MKGLKISAVGIEFGSSITGDNISRVEAYGWPLVVKTSASNARAIGLAVASTGTMGLTDYTTTDHKAILVINTAGLLNVGGDAATSIKLSAPVTASGTLAATGKITANGGIDTTTLTTSGTATFNDMVTINDNELLLTAASGSVSFTAYQGTSASHISVKLLCGSGGENVGIYDTSNDGRTHTGSGASWIIYRDKSYTRVPDWGGTGDSNHPIYFSASGVPTAFAHKVMVYNGTTTDCNTCTSTGFWRCTSGSTTNTPLDVNGLLIVFAQTTSVYWQMFVRLSGTAPRIYCRYTTNAWKTYKFSDE